MRLPRYNRDLRMSGWTRHYQKAGQTLQILSQISGLELRSAEEHESLVLQIERIVEADAIGLLLIKKDHGELLFKARSREKPVWVYQLALDWQDGLVERSIQNGTTWHASGISPDGAKGWLNDLARGPQASLLVAPLVCAGKSLGALLLTYEGLRQFTQLEQNLLEHLAVIVGRSIHNHRLVQELNIANADLEASRWQVIHSRNILRGLFDSIPTSIYIIDQHLRLGAINKQRAGRSGLPPAHLVGRPCYEALCAAREICSDCQVMETLLEGKSTNRLKRIWDPERDPEPAEWEISTVPIRNDAGQVIQAIVLEQDVTEKRRLEATLAQSEKLAAVGQLAAGIAHEINNPLTAVLANAQMLQRELEPDDDRQELVDLISRAGARASQVVRSLLDLARKEQYIFAPTDINLTISRSLELLRHEFVERDVQLVYEPAQDLPLVKASQDHLQGVWINLLSNALDAMENGHRQISILTRRQGNEVQVLVKDTGKGIPPERLSRIFEPFYTTKSLGSGTGLGLSVCHRVIKQHGGHILVDSEMDQGTQFTVILPVH